MASHRKPRSAPARPPVADPPQNWAPTARRQVARPVGITVAVMVLAGLAVAWTLTPRGPAGRSHSTTTASATRTAAGRATAGRATAGRTVAPLIAAVTLVNKSGAAKGRLPPSTCQLDTGTMVTCAAPSPGISGVVLSTYPSLPALYAAYEARVKSLNSGEFAANSQDCGLSSPAAAGEVAWNYQLQHPRDFTVAQMAAGQVSDSQAAGRVFCVMTSKAQEDMVWTQDNGRLLGWVAGAPHEDVWNWWVDVHRNITFPGTPKTAVPTPGTT